MKNVKLKIAVISFSIVWATGLYAQTEKMTGADCIKRGGAVINTLKDECPDKRVLGSVEGMRCPCVCCKLERGEAFEKRVQARLQKTYQSFSEYFGAPVDQLEIEALEGDHYGYGYETGSDSEALAEAEEWMLRRNLKVMIVIEDPEEMEEITHRVSLRGGGGIKAVLYLPDGRSIKINGLDFYKVKYPSKERSDEFDTAFLVPRGWLGLDLSEEIRAEMWRQWIVGDEMRRAQDTGRTSKHPLLR